MSYDDRAQQLLAEFRGCPLSWLDNPSRYRFLRLTTKYKAGGSLPSSTRYLGDTNTLVGVARGKRKILLIYFRNGDFEAEAYLAFPQNPIAKPTEAVGSNVFTLNGEPRESL